MLFDFVARPKRRGAKTYVDANLGRGVENRNGLIAAAMTTQADGWAERDAGLLMLHELTRKRSDRITTGADKAYDTRDFVSTLRELGVTPHVARRQNGAIDERTSRHPGYAISLSKRWLVEKPFGG